jgi:hypothetical protein
MGGGGTEWPGAGRPWIPFSQPSNEIKNWGPSTLTDDFEDLKLPWQAGDALRHGRDPYSDTRILSTTNSLPLFELFSLVPLPLLANLWKYFHLFGCILLVPLSARFIAVASGSTGRGIWPGPLAALSALVGFS